MNLDGLSIEKLSKPLPHQHFSDEYLETGFTSVFLVLPHISIDFIVIFFE